MRTSLRNNGNENSLKADCSLKIRMTDKCGCLSLSEAHLMRRNSENTNAYT